MRCFPKRRGKEHSSPLYSLTSHIQKRRLSVSRMTYIVDAAFPVSAGLCGISCKKIEVTQATTGFRVYAIPRKPRLSLKLCAGWPMRCFRGGWPFILKRRVKERNPLSLDTFHTQVVMAISASLCRLACAVFPVPVGLVRTVYIPKRRAKEHKPRHYCCRLTVPACVSSAPSRT